MVERYAFPLFLVLACNLVPTARAEVSFSREIQPILAAKCLKCHGPDKAEAGLRLNEESVAKKSLESGATAVTSGRPEASELVRRIESSGDDRMPPEGKPLSPREQELLRKWISEGAKWEGSWFLQPLPANIKPSSQNDAWVKNPIDAFVLERLNNVGLSPALPADKIALCRRAYYDLTGLPPTSEQLDAFLSDTNPQAFAMLVDQLLASPQYGEHWARKWLDVVRYAETNSFERDGAKPHVWKYRDYVIRALNQDKPFNQFIIEQLAGDELFPGHVDALTATGIYRLGVWDDEPADRDLAFYDGMDDLVTTIGQGFMGLTFNCARCHDHKVDPISQQDYYQLVAFVRNITPMATVGSSIEENVFASPLEEESHRQALEKKKQLVRAAQMRMFDVEAQVRTALLAAEPTLAVSTGDLDGIEYRYYRDSFEALPDFQNRKAETVGKLLSAKFDITVADRPGDYGLVFESILKIPVSGEYEFSLTADDGARLFMDGREVLVAAEANQERKVTVTLPSGRLPIRLEYFQRGEAARLELSWKGPGFSPRMLSGREERGIHLNEIVEQQGERLLSPPLLAEYRSARTALETAISTEPPVEKVLCVKEQPSAPPITHVLGRGNPSSPGAEVTPSFPSVFHSPSPSSTSTSSVGRRSTLAKWIASEANPLTPRVIANRVWQSHFGRGIVRSANNFGALGIPPTHPELLDWLARELISSGWSMKSLHRTIMLSNAYQMSSQADPAALTKDPQNDLFWRFDMRRLSAEEMRDSMLALTGELNLEQFGPSIYPDISDEVKAGQSVPGSGWKQSSPAEKARRSVYVHVKRSLILPIFSTFDFPETDSSCEARFITTQPAQSLAMLNGAFAREQARRLTDRLMESHPSWDEATTDPMIRTAYQWATCRAPSEAFVARCRSMLKRLQQEHGLSPRDALEQYCLLVINLNEFAYLD